MKNFDYLRIDDDGQPAAGSFHDWPEPAAELTVMDPCCGSGHFLVEAFSMLWQMRAEEEAIDPVAAQDAVLCENLFGLELDPRCARSPCLLSRYRHGRQPVAGALSQCRTSLVLACLSRGRLRIGRSSPAATCLWNRLLKA